MRDPDLFETLRRRFGSDVDPRVELGELPTVARDAQDPRSSAPGGPPAATSTRYVVEAEVGRGGMGRVLRVRDRDLRRAVAMKVALDGVEAAACRRFVEEAQITAQLTHPGVVPVHELGVDGDGRAFFTMSLVRGETLDSVIAKTRSGADGWTIARTLQVFQRICDTVGFAHERGVVHRDLKPANVMVGRFGEVYVMDWGLARVRGRAEPQDPGPADPATPAPTRIETSDAGDRERSGVTTVEGTVLGTPAYMPPEQAQGRIRDVDERSDVYAIGAMLYHLFAGHPPYMPVGARMSPHVVLACVCLQAPTPIREIDPSIAPELVAITEKAMARDPARRFASATELGDALRAHLDGLDEARRRAEIREAAATEARRRAEGLLTSLLGDVLDELRESGQVTGLDRLATAVVAHFGDQGVRSDRDRIHQSMALRVASEVAETRGRLDDAERLARAAVDVLDDDEGAASHETLLQRAHSLLRLSAVQYRSGRSAEVTATAQAAAALARSNADGPWLTWRDWRGVAAIESWDATMLEEAGSAAAACASLDRAEAATKRALATAPGTRSLERGLANVRHEAGPPGS